MHFQNINSFKNKRGNMKKTHMNIKKSSLVTAVGIATVSLSSVPALAQSSSQEIEEISVTATRRVQNLQEVPLAITAITGDALNARGVENVGNLNALAPNLNVMGGGNSGESQASFRVRGMPGVAFYIDGINQSTTDGLLTMGTVEVERVEVLRGPQGTLFGNASLGGAINYVTKAPSNELGASVRTSIGSYNRRDLIASVDLPITDTLFSKITIASLAKDGFLDSTVIDRDYGDVNDEMVRADFLWTPTEDISVRYNTEFTMTDRNGPARVVWEVGPKGNFLVGSTVYNKNANAQVYQNAYGYDYSTANSASGQGGVLGKYQTKVAWQTNGIVIDMERHTLDVGWNVNDWLRVRSLTGYKSVSRSAQVDFDGDANVILLERDNRNHNYDALQELQFVATFDNFEFVLGGYWEQSYARARTITWGLPEFTCDLWNANNAQRITNGQRATCFSNRKLALGVNNPAITTNAQLTALAPNLNGVTQSTFTGAAGNNNDQMNVTRPETQAFFGDFTWQLTDKLSVVAGLRYSEDTNPNAVILSNNDTLRSRGTWLPDNDIPQYFGAKAIAAASAEQKFDALTKRLTLSYQLNEDMMIYGSYADGYGPGGQSNLAGSVASYMARGVAQGIVSDVPLNVFRDEQTVTNYELGMRSDWLDGRLRTNITAFHTDWDNVPVSQYVATKYWDTDGNNAPDSTIDVDGIPGPDIFFFPSLWSVPVSKAIAQGIELESTWLPAENLRVDFNLGLLNTEYQELGSAGIGAVPAVRIGSQFAGAPEFTANLGVSYDINLAGGGRLLPRIDYTYTDDYTLQTGEILQRTQEAYGLVNGRLTYVSNENWSLELSGTNLTNEYFFNSGFFTRAEQIHFMTVGRPREFGLTFNMSF